MREETGRSSIGLFLIGIAALFLASFFLLVVFGAHSYRGTVASQETNMKTRSLQSYLSTAAKSYDRSGAVTVRQDAVYGPVLVIADGDSGYALHIYENEGVLLEEYALTDAALAPERSQTIGETERFGITAGDELIELETDAGRVLFRLRSGGGGS